MESGENLTEAEKLARYKKYDIKPLTPEKEAILREMYPHKHKSEIAPIIGYSPNVVVKYATALKLRKTAEYKHSYAVKRGYRLVAINKANGFKPQGRKLKPGECLKSRVGAEAFAEMHARAIKTRIKRYESERRRVLCGLEQKTKAKLFARPTKKINMEIRLRKFGYKEIDKNRWMRPETGAENHKRMEKTAISWGYKFFDYEQQ